MLSWRRSVTDRRRAFAPETKDSRVGPLIAFTAGGRARWTPKDYANLAVEGFTRNPVAYRCVRMIAETAAATPLQVFSNGARDDEHPAAHLLARPNPEQSGAEWLEGLYGALQTAGNAYVEAAGDAAPEELWSLRPDRMKVVPGRSGWPEAYEYALNGRTVRLSRAADGWMPVLHLKLFHPVDDHYGFSPLEAAMFAIDVHNASGRWNKALLDNSARPSGALVFAGRDGERLTDTQFSLLKTQIDDLHSGSANAGRPLVLEGGLDWKPLSWTPADMDFIAGKHAAAREIALAFGVPPQLLGIPGDATYANYREANVAFWRATIAPLVRKTAAALTVRIEGDTPQSRTVAAVLAGANTVAVETPLGWEIVQFRRADMVGEGIWRLSDLLRGQFGSEGEMRAGATVGGVVTFLDARPQRVQVAVGEQRLPLTWRAGPIGTPGGPAVAETILGFTGLHARPWSPARLKCRRHGNGSIDVGWVPRSRLWGDSWDGEDRASDPLRFRVRLADGDAVRREIEVTDLQVFWSAEQIAADFPDGVDGHVTVSVAQWGDGYGWGQEASLKL